MFLPPLPNPRKAARTVAALGIVGFAAVAAPSAHAQSVYLVGAYLISANSAGATSSTGYQYDTNSSSSASYLTINGAGASPKSIALALTNGTVNNFTFLSQSTTSLIGPDADLALFFASGATSYNPAPGTARTPDLLAAVPATSSTFFVPVAGTAVNNYGYQGSSTANGSSSITVNGATISFTAFTAANVTGSSAVSGSFSLNVTGTAGAPEPGSISLLALSALPAACGMGAVARRRRKVA